LKRREQLLVPLAASLAETAEKVVSCSVCGAPDTRDPCAICSDGSRDNGLICVVEEAGALWAMERSGAFRGKYHVLGGLLSALDGVGPEHLRIAELVGRVRHQNEGGGACARSSWPCPPPSMARPPPIMSPNGSPGPDVQVTSLARGVPVGGELDWLDDGTIVQAMRARRPA
jgi:recombination protein RecR